MTNERKTDPTYLPSADAICTAANPDAPVAP